jgi:hypothetical protein
MSMTNNQHCGSGENCVKFEMNGNNKLHHLAGCTDDTCYQEIRTLQSMGPGGYQVANHFDCDTMIKNTVANATENRAMIFKNGHDVGCGVIDDHSKLRIGATRKFPKCPNQLFTRPFLTVPYMGRGAGNMDLESQINPGDMTRVKRSVNTLSGVTIPHYFTPLVPHLQFNVQNPEHIVQESVDAAWVRGGTNSRNVIRDEDYLARCGYQYMNKSTNDYFWKNKHDML